MHGIVNLLNITQRICLKDIFSYIAHQEALKSKAGPGQKSKESYMRENKNLEDDASNETRFLELK